MTEYCCKCRLPITKDQVPVAIDRMRKMHQLCYGNHLQEMARWAEMMRKESTPKQPFFKSR